MSKFKKGDRVEILNDALERLEVPKGTHGTVKEDDTEPFVRWDVGKGNRIYAATEDNLRLVERTMENLQAGDILVNDKKTYNLEVQGSIGKAIITCSTHENNCAYVDSAKELENGGWKLKDSGPEIIEFTLTELAEKLNIPLEVLRIKE